MRRPQVSISVRTALALTLCGVTLAVGGAILATTFVGAERTVRSLSSRLVDNAARRAEFEIENFLRPLDQQLRFTASWAGSGLLTPRDVDAMRRLLAPVLEQNPQIAAAVIADREGNELRLLHDGSTWGLRQRLADRPGEQVWIRWPSGSRSTDRAPAPLDEELEAGPVPGPDAVPRTWFEDTLALLRSDSERSEPPELYATQPYRLVGTTRLGVTLALGVWGPETEPLVVAFDVLLAGMRDFVSHMTVGENGSVVLLSEEGRLVAAQPRVLPPGATEADWLFRFPEEIDSPLLQAASAAYARSGTEDAAGANGAQRRFHSGERAWWGQVRPFELQTGTLLIVVLIPETDLLAERSAIRRRVAQVTGVALLLALAAAVVVSRRFSSPIETLVRNAERIRVGELDAAEPVDSSLREIRDLADAGQRMRAGLAALMKVEGDLQLARQIQRSTLPSTLPKISGWNIAALSEPADETGGDTYDVMGLDEHGHLVSSADRCTRAALLLADATGHGVGPALSVAQVRGMVRGAVRSGADLDAVAEQLNEQLVVDLPRNRFITAWLGVIEADRGVLRYVSAGQGPLLVVRRDGETSRLAASSPPLGVFAGRELRMAPEIELQPGDLFVALTDGYFEAFSPEGEEFGLERVEAVLRANLGRTAEQIVEALERAVESFAAGAPAEDDRTALVLQRTG